MPGPSLSELINRGESPGDGYNDYNCGTTTDRNGRQVMLPKTGGDIDFSTLTIAEVQRRQNLAPGDPDRLGAVGMYQVIRGTLASAVTNLGLDPNQPFTPEIQDLIYTQYLLDEKRPDVRAYIIGQPGATLVAAQNGLAREWASFGSPENGGRGRYDGDGVNHASVSVAESAAALERMRLDYQTAIASGLTPNAAWAATMQADKARNDLATAPNATAKDPLADSVLQRGESGAAVVRLQQNLAALGVQFHDSNGKSLAPTGFYGEQTAQAVRDFQQSHGIEPTGVADMRTLNAINAAANPQQSQTPLLQTPPTSPPTANQSAARDPLADNVLQRGESGAAVLRLQQNLVTLGMPFHDANGKPIAPTGMYGEQTENRVRNFQQSHGLPATGVADMATLNAINAAAQQQQQSQASGPKSFADVMQIMLPQSQAGKLPHITSDFGWRDVFPQNHTGVDFNYVGGQTGTNLQHPVVHSPVSGEVISSGGPFGTVAIRDSQGNVHQILHLDSRLVQPPQRVEAGDPIGTMGGRGPTGPTHFAQHVHYEIINPKGVFVDPEQFWNQQRTQSRSSAQPTSIGGTTTGLADSLRQTGFETTYAGAADPAMLRGPGALLNPANIHFQTVFEDILAKVHSVESQRNIPHGQHSECLAGVLALASIREGVRPDRVEMSTDGSTVRLAQISSIQDEPSLNRYSEGIRTQEAVRQPLQHISEQTQLLASVARMQAPEEHVQAQGMGRGNA